MSTATHTIDITTDLASLGDRLTAELRHVRAMRQDHGSEWPDDLVEAVEQHEAAALAVVVAAARARREDLR